MDINSPETTNDTTNVAQPNLGQDMLEQMVEETYLLLNQVETSSSGPVDGQMVETQVEVVREEIKTNTDTDQSEDIDSLPGPGVVFALQFSPTTFILRLIPVQEAGDFFRPDSPLRLKFIGELKRSALPTQLHFFPTDYFELAEVISENFGGRRFPINDDLALDVDQFKGQWWIKEAGDNKFELRFTYPGEMARNRYQKIGPLGDPESVALIFDRARVLLAGPMKLSQIDINERRIILESSGAGDISPGDLTEIIMGRRPVTWAYEKTQGALGARFFRFLKEIQTMANFWQEVERASSSFSDGK